MNAKLKIINDYLETSLRSPLYLLFEDGNIDIKLEKIITCDWAEEDPESYNVHVFSVFTEKYIEVVELEEEAYRLANLGHFNYQNLQLNTLKHKYFWIAINSLIQRGNTKALRMLFGNRSFYTFYNEWAYWESLERLSMLPHNISETNVIKKYRSLIRAIDYLEKLGDKMSERPTTPVLVQHASKKLVAQGSRAVFGKFLNKQSIKEILREILQDDKE